MSFRWLPDPERYAHPLLSWVIQYAFCLVLGRRFRVGHDLPPGYEPPPGSIVVSNHQRDSDGPLIGTVLSARKGLRMGHPVPFFAAREDLFQHGALANLLYACPWPLIELLRVIPLGWLFASARTVPMRRLREFTWHDTLRELVHAGFGERKPDEVFNARGLRELRECFGQVPQRVDAIRPWRMQRLRVAYWGLRRLRRSTLRAIAPGFRATVETQLRGLEDRLDEGYSVYFAPEGRVSRDGRFGRVRAGMWRLPRMTARPPVVVPMAISYDPLRTGRTRVVIRLCAPIEGLHNDDARAVAKRVRSALAARRVVTPSHLLACFLCVRAEPFGEGDLAAWLAQAIDGAHAMGLALDPAFASESIDALATERLHWLARWRLVVRHDGMWHNHWDPATAPSWLHMAGLVRYLANALADFAPEFAETLSS